MRICIRKDVEDKWKEAGLHPYAVDGTTAVEEADLIFVCKTQYTQDMKPECFDVKEMMRNGIRIRIIIRCIWARS